MKFLVINTDYSRFLEWFYAKYPGLQDQPYGEQVQKRIHTLFGVADFYSRNLQKLGHEAWTIFANIEPMQREWAREHGIKLGPERAWQFRLRRGVVPWISLSKNRNWFLEILREQIKYYRPDILLNQAMSTINTQFLKEIKPYTRLLVGQHAATKLSESERWGCYDLVISSFNPTLDWFRRKGLPSELSRLAFEPKVLSGLGDRDITVDISFIGNFYRGIHDSRVKFVEKLCDRFNCMNIWGPYANQLSSSSSISKYYVGQAWGREMYQILQNSKITLNHHGDVPPYANNMRLFEATGVGTLLVTDWKKNLSEMFEPGKEIIAYRNSEECVELIRYYLENDDERRAIAKAGQRRTLSEHTYYHRMEELVEIVKKYLM